MSVTSVVQSLQDVLLQVNDQTLAAALIADRSNTKKTYVEWVDVAEKTALVADVTELPQMTQLVLALKYRIQSLKGEDPAEFNPLMEFFKKLSTRVFPTGIAEEFTEKQLRHLCSKYPSFAQKLLEPIYEKLAEDFFRFALLAPSQSSHRGKNTTHWVDIFVQYPEIAERLMKSSLYEKLGQYSENVCILPVKEVCLKMELQDEIQWVSIHLRKANLEHPLVFRNKALGGQTPGITLSLEEIFNQFESPLLPDLDVSSTGIVNINSQLLISKDSHEKIHHIDPMKWTEYMPSIELELPELMNLFPEAKNESPFAFILRVNAFASKDGQAFFDFIMRLDNGKYRVISLQGHQSGMLHQQKRVFYPLNKKQGETVIDMVAKEITQCREAHAEGKPIPTIDIQSYLDGIIGHDFYAYIEKFISKPYIYPRNTNDELKIELVQVRQNLDTAAFEEFLRPVIDKMMNTRDMALIHQFITTSLTTIHTMLQKDSKKIVLPTEQEVTEASKKNLNKMGPSLVALASLCFDVLHPYRISVAAAEKDTPVLGFIFRTIESIPWEWLKNLLYNFFLTVLGPSRGYHYKTLANPHPRSWSGIAQSVRNLVPGRYINRPSQLFDTLCDDQKQSVENRMKAHLSVLTVPVDNKIVI
jgi:hypothetical protein